MARRERTAQGESTAVRALDVDGVRTTAIITVLWALAFVILAVRRDDLEAAGRGWWMWTCLAGVGLGLLGLEYCRKRRDAIARAELDAEAEADLDDATDWQDGELAAMVAEAEDEAPQGPADTGEYYPGGPPQHVAPRSDETAQHYPGGPPSHLSDDTQHYYPEDYPADPRYQHESPPAPEPETHHRQPGPPFPPPPEEPARYAPGGRPPPGYVTGEFPAVAQPPASPPQHQSPQQSAQPEPPPAPQVSPEVNDVASPAGYMPEPDRVRRHPRDEEIARLRAEQQPPAPPPADFLGDDGYEYREPESADAGEFYQHQAPYVDDLPATPAPPEPDYGRPPAQSELLSELFDDEPAPRPSSGPEFLLDEPDESGSAGLDDDEDDGSGEYRGRRARRD